MSTPLACCKLRHISTVLNRNFTKWWILRSRALQQEMNSDLRAVDLGAPTASWEINELRKMTHVSPMKTHVSTINLQKNSKKHEWRRVMFASVQECASKQAFRGSYRVFI